MGEKNIKTLHVLEAAISSLKWLAYDTDFTPGKLDRRFRVWAEKGITAVCAVMRDGKLLPFETLKEKYGLEKEDFYRYLQMRHFLNSKVLPIKEEQKGLIFFIEFIIFKILRRKFLSYIKHC